jgi:CRISPR/Cas system CSM-associated protein Csm3 (group 7 of RAMP superfamily)
MTDALTFRIDFHGPFRVSTGRATGRGADEGVDRALPLPGESLKGLMRASARVLLACARETEPSLIQRVFGTAARSSPWSWSAASPTSGPWRDPTLATRVRIDAVTHTAVEDYLATVEQVWAPAAASFTVERTALIEPDDLHDQMLLLRAAAGGVHALGADRRRGLGWVTVTCPADPMTEDDVGRLHAKRGA